MYVPVFADLTQKDKVRLSAEDVPYLRCCKFLPSIFCRHSKRFPASKEESAVVQSNFCEVVKPSPVGTVVLCEISQVPALLATNSHLSTV